MKITAQELRNKYLDFFKSKGHAIIPSASLVPENDASVFFTTAGMHPLVPYLLGQQHPKGTRLANVQKCIRTGDIEEVGDDTHLTFFEMLGNWSLGDYFKQEAIKWSFEFLTNSETGLGLPLEKLAFSVFAGDEDAPRDEESAGIWKTLGVENKRIAYLPKEDNWWIAGASGPCGPDTEMFFWIDDGTKAPDDFQATKDDKRWVEIWNDVFMQYEKKSDGKLVPLNQKSVDTGMGLDRVLAVLNGQKSVYDTELFKPMFDVLGLKNEILSNDEVKKARITLDHIRASVFMVGDWVEPSNKDRGYVLRRLLRRSMVMAKLLNLQKTWLKALVGQVMAIYVGAYPELVGNSERIFGVIEGEKKRFEETLDSGLKHFDSKILGLKMHKLDLGEEFFDLYQTHGFPLEISKDLSDSLKVVYDPIATTASFNLLKESHQSLSRTASAGQFKGGLGGNSEKIIKYHTATHLLNAALRDVLGEHVFQKGSNITEERTRFDFTHSQKMTEEEKLSVEALVNDWITRDFKVKKETMSLEEAHALGAIGVFGEKYTDTVSVYTVFDESSKEIISRELCGGPHVEHTGIIGHFKIVKEEASSAGVRRIRAVVE